MFLCPTLSLGICSKSCPLSQWCYLTTLSSDAPFSFCYCSVTHSCPTLCNPMNYSIAGIPVLHYLPEFAQNHVHWVGDAIQLSHPPSSPSPPVFKLFQHQGFSNVSALYIRWPKYWSFSIRPSNGYSELVSFRNFWFDFPAVQVQNYSQFSQKKQQFLICLNLTTEYQTTRSKNWYAEYIIWNSRLDEAQARIKMLGEIAITSYWQIKPPLWHKVKN